MTSRTWRSGAASSPVVLTTLARRFSPLVAPMTALDESYADEVLGAIRAAGEEVFHVVLDVSAAELVRRIQQADPETDPDIGAERRRWRLAHRDRYREALGWLRRRADAIIATDVAVPASVAQRVVLSYQEHGRTVVGNGDRPA